LFGALKINTTEVRDNFLHRSAGSYEKIDSFAFPPACWLANPSHLRYALYRYGTFPAISDAF
jgi:hypothetical protein